MYSRQKEIMQSNIEFAEFKNRLLKHTAILNIDILGTPLIGVAMFFNPSEKKFCGQVSSNSFVITTYNTLFPIPYKIEGEMCAESDSTTNVKYVVKPIWLL